MKKFKISYLWLLMLLPLMGACSKEDIVFDVELPRFELRPGYQLLEVIVPQRTMPTDKIYIVGEFNGGKDVAVGDPRWELEKAHDAEAAARKSQVGTGDRSEKIRTYNFPQGRLTDHRIGLTIYKLEKVMDGDIEEIIDACIAADQAAKLANMAEG